MRKIISVSLIFLLLFSTEAFSSPRIGDVAPDFSVVDTQGVTRTLSQLKGNIVVLEWTNPDCPFVKKHYGSNNMQSLQKRYTAKGVLWFSVNSSAPEKQGNYSPEELNMKAAKQGASPTALIKDEDGVIGRLFSAKTTPTMVVIDKAGKIAYQGAIDDNDSVSPDDALSAKNYVSLALEALLTGKAVEIGITDSYGCSVKYKS